MLEWGCRPRQADAGTPVISPGPGVPPCLNMGPGLPPLYAAPTPHSYVLTVTDDGTSSSNVANTSTAHIASTTATHRTQNRSDPNHNAIAAAMSATPNIATLNTSVLPEERTILVEV